MTCPADDSQIKPRYGMASRKGGGQFTFTAGTQLDTDDRRKASTIGFSDHKLLYQDPIRVGELIPSLTVTGCGAPQRFKRSGLKPESRTVVF